jgi:hypothetical protein
VKFLKLCKQFKSFLLQLHLEISKKRDNLEHRITCVHTCGPVNKSHP